MANCFITFKQKCFMMDVAAVSVELRTYCSTKSAKFYNFCSFVNSTRAEFSHPYWYLCPAAHRPM